MKDILIIGSPRCGKSTLTNKFLERHPNYEPIRADSFLRVRQKEKSEHRYDEETHTNIVEIYSSTPEEIAFYIRDVLTGLKNDLNPINKNSIVDCCQISVEEAYNKFIKDCDIYCFGMPNIDLEELMIAINENDKEYDWTRVCGYYMFENLCRNIIRESKENQKLCSKYGIKFFDMQGNRKEKIDAAIKYIEANSKII